MTLPSLRPVIAEIMVHTIPVSDDPGAWLCHLFGAETLHWCDEREGGLDDEEVAELEFLRSAVEGIEDRLTHLDGSTGKPMTAAAFRRDVERLLSDTYG